MEQVEFKTEDGVKISGVYYKSPHGSPGVSLFHMMPSTKESWSDFAGKLNKAGAGVLAIDLRGHGTSEGGPEGYKKFSDEDHQKSIMDARSAVLFQKKEGHRPIFVAGASIGANLALQILALDPEIKGAILFSPGLDYRGINTLAYAQNIRPEQKVFIIAANDDKRVSEADRMAEEIFGELSTQNKEKEIFSIGGHGTDILGVNPSLTDKLVNWIIKI
ncbi:MAG: hypothetical protein COU46_02740 [Candidatus Niyogibacteria bacterium CG10_big_fil_rev_8_21_14_0_10_42_19]|uniref:Serine aminopeptidase S33 domain-containing protein n=1 Tax=Candidatus Niyogibacteria bacterium CG10_big_fil_rev_8_21_14_0_10_42_19 TaxID=1974725 RepID=A0A2H0TF35_9BACT|nr:MAG: hypothetical protein COU46_02740 [Candidatus Niyogibacteria bacterium CG10_big_fil_rev_8_21_14_0_10_42_19]